MKPTPPKSKPAKTVKARKRYLLDDNLTLLHAPDKDTKPLFILPADPEAIEQMREQVAEEVMLFMDPYSTRQSIGAKQWAYYLTRADAALQALGLVAPRDGKKGAK